MKERGQLLISRNVNRHARESGHPGVAGRGFQVPWIPAFAGMTEKEYAAVKSSGKLNVPRGA
jgi:hypothetical protein